MLFPRQQRNGDTNERKKALSRNRETRIGAVLRIKVLNRRNFDTVDSTSPTVYRHIIAFIGSQLRLNEKQQKRSSELTLLQNDVSSL